MPRLPGRRQECLCPAPQLPPPSRGPPRAEGRRQNHGVPLLRLRTPAAAPRNHPRPSPGPRFHGSEGLRDVTLPVPRRTAKPLTPAPSRLRGTGVKQSPAAAPLSARSVRPRGLLRPLRARPRRGAPGCGIRTKGPRRGGGTGKRPHPPCPESLTHALTPLPAPLRFRRAVRFGCCWVSSFLAARGQRVAAVGPSGGDSASSGFICILSPRWGFARGAL